MVLEAFCFEIEPALTELILVSMLRVDKRKRNASIRAVESAAKRQCKKDELQTEALLTKVRDWSAHMFDSKRVETGIEA
jgi:hypothetical protein